MSSEFFWFTMLLFAASCAAGGGESTPDTLLDASEGDQDTSPLDVADAPAPIDADGGEGADATRPDTSSADADDARSPLDGAERGDTPQDVPQVDCSMNCDDESACTIDACDPTSGCVHLPLTCTDQDPCTIDGCEPTSGCTFSSYSCDDGEECTTDICYGNGLCKNESPECEDNNSCTIDTCASGACAYTVVECDDGDPCTADTCQPDVGCTVNATTTLCCTTDSECSDASSCTKDSCDSGLCVHSVAVPGECCLVDSDCPGGSACQAAFCASYACQLVAVEGPECCSSADECNDDDDCTADSCAQNTCVHASTCCVDDQECDDGDAICTTDECVQGKCFQIATLAEGCCTTDLYANDFEGGTQGGFTFQNEYEVTGVGWKIVPSGKAKSGVWVLYYGNPVTQSYNTGATANSGLARTPAVALPAGVRSRLELQLRMETELGTYSDRLLIRIVEFEGAQPLSPGTLLWTKKGFFAANQWVALSLDLSAWAGKTVWVEFDFDTFDAAPTVGEGVFIDALKFVSDCSPLLCDEDADCEDGLFSTASSCIEGYCSFEPNPLNCEVHADCVDDNPCTSDVCGDYQCFNVPQSWCCATDGDCVDSFACTLDKCILSGSTPFCTHNWQVNCCDVDSTGKLLFCDDSDPCTLDSCPVPGAPCVHQPIAGCCESDADCSDQDTCTIDLCNSGACTNLDLCCAADDECDDGDDACTAEACVEGLCAYVLLDDASCCMTSMLEETFESGAGALELVPTATPPPGGAGWTLTTSQAHSGTASIWFGSLATGTYEVAGQAAAGTLKTANPVQVPILAFTTLTFHVWMGVEYAFGAYPNADFDRLTVRVQPLSPISKVAEGPPTTLWDSAWGTPTWWEESATGVPVGPKWTEVAALNLTPWAGKPVHIIFEFDTKDAFNNDFPGVFVDDVIIERTCSIVAPQMTP